MRRGVETRGGRLYETAPRLGETARRPEREDSQRLKYSDDDDLPTRETYSWILDDAGAVRPSRAMRKPYKRAAAPAV